jgi:DNA repair exonuclease SbcCD ATPase subunit
MKSQMQGQQRRINLAGLRTALENTLRLSKRQESLRTTIDNLAAEGPTLRSYARDQKVLSDGLKTVTDSLESIAERVPQMTREVQQKSGNALRAMETATSALDERNANRATGHQKTSMMHLNELALLISDLLEQLQNQQGSGSGMSMQQMIQQLQKMSGQQQKLNQQIQQHLNQTQGQRLTPDQSKRRKELAKQQRRIRQQLQNMDVGSEAKQQIMGDLQKIAEQMEESAQELERGRQSRDLIERQQQILTRLLNAQKSLRTQGKQEQRKGRQAEDEYDQKRPGPLPQTDETDQLRRDLIRALEMGYSPDYEELIKRYFELLQQNGSSAPADTTGP